jgi:hypothetical protein
MQNISGMDVVKLILMMIVLPASKAERNATEWNFREDISPKWTYDAEVHVARVIWHMKLQKNPSLWPHRDVPNPYGPKNPLFDAHDYPRRLQTYLMVSHDDVCKATNVSAMAYKLTKTEKDCTFKNRQISGRNCDKPDNTGEIYCPNDKLWDNCDVNRVNYDEFQFCCGTENKNLLVYDHITIERIRRHRKNPKNLQDCCLFPGSYCFTRHPVLPCCGKKHGLVHNFKCMIDKYDWLGNSEIKDRMGHCWFPGIAGLKGHKPPPKKH